MNVEEYIESEVDKIVDMYKDVPESSFINNYKEVECFDKGDYYLDVVLDEEIETLTEFVIAFVDLIADRLDTPFPDDRDDYTIMWNPDYKIDNNQLVIIPEWSVVENRNDESEIEKERHEIKIK